jgi:flagellar assembly factor FliW
VDPTTLVPDYQLSLEGADLAALGAPSDEPLEVVVPVVLPRGDERLSLNLKGPLVLAPRLRRGVQVVSRDDRHPIRFDPDRPPESAACSS